MSVFGTLIAEGTEDNMITFTSDSSNPDGADWQHLYLGYGSKVKYCIIEYSRAGVDVAPGTEDSIVISNTIIRHNLWTGIPIHSASPTITYNEIYDSGGHQGIDTIGENCNPLIENNIIRQCKVGIIVPAGNNSPIIKNNTFLNNDFGITVFDNATPIIEGNTISSTEGAGQDWTYKGKSIYFGWSQEKGYVSVTGINIQNSSPIINHNIIEKCAINIKIDGNSYPVITHNSISNAIGWGIIFGYSFSGEPEIYENSFKNNHNIALNSNCSIDVINNWWSTTNPEDIEARIWHSCDDSSLGTVIYEPFLTHPLELD